MKTRRAWTALTLCVGLMAITAKGSFAAERQSPYFNTVPAMEILVLPRYCWAQYLQRIPATPEYTISRELCGVGTNHMCEGLIDLNRVIKSHDLATRGLYLNGARRQFLYTLKAIENYPSCPIRADAEKGLREVEQLSNVPGK